MNFKFSIRFLFVLTSVLAAWFFLVGYLFFAATRETMSEIGLFIPLVAAAPCIALGIAALFAWVVGYRGKPEDDDLVEL
jgi:Na+-translocating ferredoxin:NAD+ oxidoreductase RnfE subunit